MKTLTTFLILILTAFSVVAQTSNEQNENFILERLPEWFMKDKPLNGLELMDNYVFDNRLNPLYLEADFNGDGNYDIAIPIKNKANESLGFAIIHGKTNEVFIIGAGTKIQNALGDNLDYIDIWKVSRKKVNEAGLKENTGTGEKGELILKNPSIQIEKSELGGGQIYWNGKEYAYFHQSC